MGEIVKTNIDKIPIYLMRIKGWAGFIIEDGKKKPISLLDMAGVGATDTDRLVDFETAKAAYLSGTVAAIGVSIKDQDITCIDIDCHDDSKREKFEKLNQLILDQFDTYAETSISGLGTHLFVKGKKPEGYKHCDADGIIEVYSGARFLVTTGNIIDGHDTYFAICQDELNKLCSTYLIKKETYSGAVSAGAYTKTDDEVLEKIKRNKKGALFLEGKWDEVERWDDTTGAYTKAFPSQSEADFSFACLLLYFNGNQPIQAERLFLRSGMWSEKRKAKKSSDYVKHTIAEASLRCSRVFDWDKFSYTDTEQKLDFDEVMYQYNNNILVTQAQNNSLTLTTNKKLNNHISKYIINFGSKQREVLNTLHGDLDSSANGVRFWLVNQMDLIYLPNGDEWLSWNGKYWDRKYDVQLLEYAERVFYHLKHEAYNLFRQSIIDSELRQELEEKALELFEYAGTKKNKRGCLEMVEFSKTHFIKSQEEQFVSNKIYANSNVINLKNGVFSFDDMKLYPHSREFYQTKMAGVAYEEGAACPLWVDFLNMVLPHEPVRRYLQKAIGYTLSSEYMEKCMFILYGENGNNGKTTITKVIYRLMGDYAVAAEKQTIMDTRGHNAGAPRPDLVRLRDRRFVCISENEKEDKLAEGLIKNLTGGGILICRTLNHEPVEFPALFKMFLDTNYKPQVKGTDQALWNRLKILNFDVTIPPDKIDLSFSEKLEGELSGILNWGIEGYRLYKSEGLSMPDEMKILIDDYSEDMSSLDQWYKECIQVKSSIEKIGPFYTSKELFQSYKNWCEYNGEFNWTQRKFTQELNKKSACKQTKTVQGYIKYLAIELTEIGVLCLKRKDYFPDDFDKEYNKRVNSIFLRGAAVEKEFKEKGLRPIQN